jgi:hypothetical protein
MCASERLNPAIEKRLLVCDHVSSLVQKERETLEEPPAIEPLLNEVLLSLAIGANRASLRLAAIATLSHSIRDRSRATPAAFDRD